MVPESSFSMVTQPVKTLPSGVGTTGVTISLDPELSANYEQLMELQTKIDEENQVQESLLERMMETELELEEMETSESAFVRRQERY